MSTPHPIPHIGQVGSWESVVVPLVIITVSFAIAVALWLYGMNASSLVRSYKREGQLMALTFAAMVLTGAPVLYWSAFLIQTSIMGGAAS